MEDMEDTINYVNETLSKDGLIVFPILGSKNGKRYNIAKYVESVINPKVYCKFCGKVLKNPKSKQNGFGKGCYEKWVKSKAHKRRLV